MNTLYIKDLHLALGLIKMNNGSTKRERWKYKNTYKTIVRSANSQSFNIKRNCKKNKFMDKVNFNSKVMSRINRNIDLTT